MTSCRRLTPRTLGLVLAVVSGLAVVPVVRAAADHLVLTEIVVREREPRPPTYYGSPFIEIANPTAADVDLSDVYIATTQDVSLDRFYWTIVQDGGVGASSSGNFHCRFPDGMTIAAGDTLVIALKGSADFQLNYGHQPDLELFEDGTAPDAVPEMRAVAPGSIGAGLGSSGSNVPRLSDTFDSIVMYRWDGATDLVQDLDYLVYGSDTRVRVDKTGVAIDGVDVDQASSTYLDDTPVASQHPALAAAPTFGHSLQRLSFDETGEAESGGNGLTGHDETSENLAASWHDVSTQEPAAAPETWYRTAPIVTAATASSPAYAGLPVTLAATVLSHDALAAVTFHYAVNGGDEQTLPGTSGAASAWTAAIEGLAVEDTVAWYVTAATTEGATATVPMGGFAHANTFGVIEAPQQGEGPAKLLFTEVCTTPTPGEFVEIDNPNDFDVSLANYYLTDALYAPSSEYYWRVVEGNPTADNVGGDGTFGDFHIRFPADAVVAAGDRVTVSLGGSDGFEGQFGVLPDFEMFEDGAVPDDVPDMVPVFDGSNVLSQYGDLTNFNVDTGNGELVILYYWDQLSDLVTDIDIVIWGNGSSYRFSKTGVSIDGIDPDTTPTSYAPDTAPANQDTIMFAHAVGESYTRIDMNEGEQIATGSNGVDGRDELSENWSVTFAAETATPDPPTGGGNGGGGEPAVGEGVALSVPSRTFLPRLGETFPITFGTRENSETRLRLYDLDGRLVVTLFDSHFDAVPTNLHKVVVWDGRDQDYELVRAGVYVAHLSVVDETTGDEETKTVPVVVATRLK